MSDTLVLNKNYQAIDRVSWQDAFTAVCAGRAEIVDTYSDWVVHSPNSEFKVPSIIRFLGKAFFFKRGVRFSRLAVFLRDKGACGYCNRPLAKNNFTLDHIYPRAHAKKDLNTDIEVVSPRDLTSWSNVITSCKKCNSEKGGRTPEEAGMKLLRKPTKPNPHPGVADPSIGSWQEGMPESWKDYLPEYAYWVTKEG